MGKEVVRQENEDEPGQRTRLIDDLDVLHVLENNSGTDSVKSIRFNKAWLVKQSIQVDALKEMINLRFIKVVDIYHPSSFPNDDTWLSFKHLKYLEWDYFPRRRINIDMSNVVVIKLRWSKLETLTEGFGVFGWEMEKKEKERKGKESPFLPILGGRFKRKKSIGCFPPFPFPFSQQTRKHKFHRFPFLSSKKTTLEHNVKNLKKLRVLNVRRSESLSRTGNFVGLENLEELDLSWCCNLKEVDSSIVCLEKLRVMDFSWCRNIKSIPNLPPNIEKIDVEGCFRLVCLPSNMYELQSLTFLNLNYCMNIYSIPNLRPNIEIFRVENCESLVCLPSNMYEFQSLTSLSLNGCKNIYSIPNLPPNIKRFSGNNCESLSCLPSNMYELQSLTWLSLDGCVTLGSETFVKLTGLRNLRVLSMRNCNVSQVSTEIGNLVSLEWLRLSGNGFSTLPDSFSNLSQLVELGINDCSELDYLPLLPSNLKKIEANGCRSLEVMPFDSRRMANIFRSKMFKESLFTRKLCINLTSEIPDWCSTTNKEMGNVFSFVAPMQLDKKICGVILLFDKTTSGEYEARMLNKTKETGHRLDNDITHYQPIDETYLPIDGTYQPPNFILYPLNDATLMVEAGDSLEIQFEVGGPVSCGLLTFIYEGDVKDSELVIRNRCPMGDECNC